MLGSPFFVKADAWVELVKQVLYNITMKKHATKNISPEITNFLSKFRCSNHDFPSTICNF